MSFSERIGLVPPRTALQVREMDGALRTALWNALTIVYFDWTLADEVWGKKYATEELSLLIERLWVSFFHRPLDSIPNDWSHKLDELRERFDKMPWNRVYEFIEFCADNFPVERENERFRETCNILLEREKSAYRFVGRHIAELTSPEELNAIEEASSLPDRFSVVSEHLRTALGMLSDRTRPDYRNSIKESISAVESIASLLAGMKAPDLNAALKALEKRKRLHPALRKGFDSLYGFTSDADGVRHALMEESDLTFADAKFMFVACSAFVNYLKEFIED